MVKTITTTDDLNVQLLLILLERKSTNLVNDTQICKMSPFYPK